MCYSESAGLPSNEWHQLVTGHTEGSMGHWQGLQERLGAAFGVSGYEGAGKQPVANMHWHANAVGCMDVASNG